MRGLHSWAEKSIFWAVSDGKYVSFLKRMSMRMRQSRDERVGCEVHTEGCWVKLRYAAALCWVMPVPSRTHLRQIRECCAKGYWLVHFRGCQNHQKNCQEKKMMTLHVRLAAQTAQRSRMTASFFGNGFPQAKSAPNSLCCSAVATSPLALTTMPAKSRSFSVLIRCEPFANPP